MHGTVIATALLATAAATDSMADAHRHAPRNAAEMEVADLLRSTAGSVACDEKHFIFGVGYIDGSYMERIFYVEGAGNRPSIKVEFSGAGLPNADSGGGGPPDIPPVPFVVELQAPRVLHAVPAGDGWRLGGKTWDSSLRFKYTTWYGEVRRESGAWKIDWQGYRRPMLPASVTQDREVVCAMFYGR